MSPQRDGAAISGEERGARAKENNKQPPHSNTRAAQQQRLLEALRVAPVNTFEGRAVLGVPHVAGRIQDLREAGFAIVTTWTLARGDTGAMHRIARYALLREPRQEVLL